MLITPLDPLLLELEAEHAANGWAAHEVADGPLPEMPSWLRDAPVIDHDWSVCGCCDGAGAVSGFFGDGGGAVPAEELPFATAEAGWAVPGVWPDPDSAPAAEPLDVGALIAQLQDVVGRLEQVRASELPRGRAMGEVQVLLDLTQRLRVLLLPRLADVRGRELFTLTGHRSTGAWLAAAAPDADPTDATLGWELRGLRHLDTALGRGRVSLVAAERVRKACGKVRRHVDCRDGLIDGQPAEPVLDAVVGNVRDLVCRQWMGVADDDPRLAALDAQLGAITRAGLRGASQADRLEQAFTVLAEYLPAVVLQAALDEIVDALLPNLLEQEAERAASRRALRLDPKPGGGWRLHADLTQECGERLRVSLAAEARRDSRNAIDTADWQQVRQEAERSGRDLSEVLAGLAAREWSSGGAESTDSAESTDGGEDVADERGWWEPDDGIVLRKEPTLIRSDGSWQRPRSRAERLHDALDLMLGRYLSCGLGGEHGKVPVQMTVTMTAGLLEGRPGALPARGPSGRPLARSLVRGWWCDSHVTALLLSGGYRPLGVVHSARTLTGVERNAGLVQTDLRCAGLGCCSGTPDPLIDLVPHHLRLHAVTGTTSLTETVWLCATAHHDLHTGKRTIQLRDGRWINEEGEVDPPRLDSL